jgi:sugar-specific transcriptional regulator TrmB
MHRQVAYDALEGLENKKMVVKTTKNNRLYFRVANPQNILDNIKQQESIAKSLIMEINSKLAGQKKGQEIRIYEGAKAYREFVMRQDDLQPANSEYLVVTGAAMRFKELMQPLGVFERSNRIRLEKNIKTRLIFSNIDIAEALEVKRINSEYRLLPKGFASPTSFDIWQDCITLNSYGAGDGSDMFCIEIRNDDFRKAYLNYFELLWGIAKK